MYANSIDINEKHLRLMGIKKKFKQILVVLKYCLDIVVTFTKEPLQQQQKKKNEFL